MKFPNYSGGAQGDLLIANALDADNLRPYAEVRHHDQIVSKQGMHLYVEREEELATETLSDAVGGVLRMVGHGADGYETFKGNGEDAYSATGALYVVDGQTNPAASWPTFWRRGLSGPAAMWAQFARGFAQAYVAWQTRGNSFWPDLPDIGDAVVVIERPRLTPLVFCIKGQLGAGPVLYLPVAVLSEAEFSGAPVPDAISDLFGGVPMPPMASAWAGAVPMSALSPDAIRAALGVVGAAWQWREGLQAMAVGPYATDQNQADTVVVMQHATTLVAVAAHLRVVFSVGVSGSLGATIARISDGCPFGSLLAVRGAMEYGGLAAGAIPVGGVGPGWTEPGVATCPLVVTYIDGQLSTVTYLRRRWIKPNGSAQEETGTRVAGVVSLEMWDDRAPPSGTLALLNFWGEEGGFYVIAATDNRDALYPDTPWSYGPVALYLTDRQAEIDLNAVYPHFGLLPLTSVAQLRHEELLHLTSFLPRANPSEPAFIDVARSVVGGQQIVGRLAGLQDPDYALSGVLTGSLVETAEDRGFPNGPYVTFVGELQE